MTKLGRSSRIILAAALGLAAALDISTYYRLPALGETEFNPIVATFGTAAVVAKLALAAGIILAVMRQLPYFLPVGVVAAGWWGFGALVNYWR